MDDCVRLRDLIAWPLFDTVIPFASSLFPSCTPYCEADVENANGDCETRAGENRPLPGAVNHGCKRPGPGGVLDGSSCGIVARMLLYFLHLP